MASKTLWRLTVTFHGEHHALEPVSETFDTYHEARDAMDRTHDTMAGSGIAYAVTMRPVNNPVAIAEMAETLGVR